LPPLRRNGAFAVHQDDVRAQLGGKLHDLFTIDGRTDDLDVIEQTESVLRPSRTTR
jgi:hypothetical protein